MAGTTLYTPPGFWRSYPVLIAAEYSDVMLRVVSEGPEFCPETGCATPYFLSRFPQGKVPVLVADSGFCVQESNAAAYYVSSDVLQGPSQQESSLVQQWINFAESELIPPVAAWVFPTLGLRKSSKLEMQRAREDVKKVLVLLNDHLHVRTYLVGEHVTLADITLVCAMLGLYKQVLEPALWEQFADVNRWFTTCLNQSPFQRILGEVKFCEPAVQCPAREPSESRAEQDVAREAAGIETCLVATPKDNGCEEEVGPVITGLCNDTAAVKVHLVASSAEGGPAGGAAGDVGVVDLSRQDRPAKIESLIDASQEELSVVCAMEDRTNEVGSVAHSREDRTTNESNRIHLFIEAVGTKDEAIANLLIDLSEEAVCITGASKEHGEAEEEAVDGIQVSEETKPVEAFNELASTADGCTEQGTSAVSVASSLGEDRPNQLEVSLVDDLKEGSVADVCKPAATEEGPGEVSRLDVPECQGVEEASMAEVQGLGASEKDSSVDLKAVDASKADAPSEEVATMGTSDDGLAREEAVGEPCMVESLMEARAVALGKLDSSENLACKPKVTSAVDTLEDSPTTVGVGLLETSKEEICIVAASLQCGSVSVVDAPKGDWTTPRWTVDATQECKLVTEDTMGASRECADDLDPTADQLKAKDPFAHLPKSVFVLDEFKWRYSNEDIHCVALPYFWDHFDKEGWSVWYMEYKYPHELHLAFMSSNLITGMFQRFDGLRKHGFASVILFGTDDESSISGIWILRGKQLPCELNEDWRVVCEAYSWKKLDVDMDECRTMVNEYFAMEGTFRHVGKPFNQGKIFK
uniref:elongation factor 1-gamma-like isoform X2 n=1 Tax=Pristiophorus japonicus TaxID=55135 RepID=UPI00398E3C64